MKTPKYYGIEDIQRDYEQTSQGHWFDRGTMRFFKTRLTSQFKILSDTEYLFITTEKGPSNVRTATVRYCRVEPDTSRHCGYRINIGTVGAFNELTMYQAKKLMNETKELRNEED